MNIIDEPQIDDDGKAAGEDPTQNLSTGDQYGNGRPDGDGPGDPLKFV